MKLFKRKRESPGIAFKSITLCTVKLNTSSDFKAFCDFGYNNRMVIDYAISDREDWKRIDPIPDCFAVISYVPEAGMGRLIRVHFAKWTPYNAKGLSERFEASRHNYECVSDFLVNYSPDVIFWLASQVFGSKI